VPQALLTLLVKTCTVKLTELPLTALQLRKSGKVAKPAHRDSGRTNLSVGHQQVIARQILLVKCFQIIAHVAYQTDTGKCVLIL
jgi:hypothetical protein